MLVLCTLGTGTLLPCLAGVPGLMLCTEGRLGYDSSLGGGLVGEGGRGTSVAARDKFRGCEGLWGCRY